MIITNFLVRPFQEEFKNPLKTASYNYKYRSGFIIKIYSSGYVGFGESSPLPGFSMESLKEVSYALEVYRLTISDIGETSIEELISLIPICCGDLPSVQFGLETAIYDLASKMQEQTMSRYLNPDSNSHIESNGVFGLHNSSNNFSTIKVKIGFNNIFDELDRLKEIRHLYGDGIKLRLDANGSMDLVRAIRFCKEIEDFNIDYIEQPLPKDELEDLAELRNHTDIPIALDESLTDFSSLKKIISLDAADIVILKPTITGGFEECKDIFKFCESNQVSCIITSALEGPVGLSACAHFAAALCIDKPCGLSTGILYRSHINQPFIIKDGFIKLSEESGLGFIYDSH